jgi:glycerol-3-phosphate acyltransferase PlsY
MTAFAFRMSSLAALTAAALSPLLAFFLHGGAPGEGQADVILCLFMAILIFIRHHENIARLLKGTEPRIGKKTA